MIRCKGHRPVLALGMVVAVWQVLGVGFARADFQATGGNIANYILNGTNYTAYTFTSSGTLTVTAGATCEVLVVAGGGGGGQTIGGGGGAGGFLYNAAFSITAGTYSVTVGAGGAGAVGNTGTYGTGGGTSGGNSTFASLNAFGGGGGGNYNNGANGATAGGSGGGMGAAIGGGPMAGTNGQGYAGGTTTANNNDGAGGGGAGGVGANAVSGTAGAGGAGLSSAISGTTTNYAGGGGGGARNGYGNGGAGGSGVGGAGNVTNGANALANSGGGGGGGGYGNPSSSGGGNGGSGIVIVRYGVIPIAPVILNGAAQNISATSADITGTLLTNGADVATVSLYWNTADGKTNESDWLAGGGVTNFGPYATSALFTNTLSGLSSNTTYFWNHKASNSSGTTWAATSGSPSFRTFGNPAVNNGAGATAVTHASAILSGNLTTGSAAYVYILLGTTDGVWTRTNYMGYLSDTAGAFTTNVTGLTPGATYYYQCYASNVCGTASATPSASFTTYPANYTWYVAPAGAGIKDGSTWGNAFDNLQPAVNIAASGDTICLKYGTYSNTAPVAINGKSGITIAGGFLGSGAPGATTSAASVLTRNAANNIRIVDASFSTNVTLQGVTIAGGYLPQSDFGAGLRVTNSSGFAVINSTISNNTVTTAANDVPLCAAGGVYASASGVTLSNCQIMANQVSITGARGYTDGGGVYVNSGTCLVMRCELRGNVSACPISNGARGGAICLNAGLLDVRNCLIAANDVTSGGFTYGGGVDVVGGTATLSLCTIVNNGVSGIQREGGTLTATNSILWGSWTDAVGTVTLNYCDFQSGTVGVTANNCLSTDPLFERGLYLASGSPCVDRGSDMAANLGVAGLTTRADGTADAGTVDMGYHSAAGNNASVADLYVAPAGNDNSGNGSQGTPFATITKALSLAQAGTRVHVAAGLYTNTAAETLPLNIVKDGVQMLGTNAAVTQISGGGIRLPVKVANSCGDTRLEGLTIASGYQAPAAANGSINGGGVYASLSGLTIASCTVTNNKLVGWGNYANNFGAGICLYNCAAVITNCAIKQNNNNPGTARSVGNGGGLAALGGRCDIVDSVVAQNITAGDIVSGTYIDAGSGIYLGSGIYTLRNCLVYTNVCQSDYISTNTFQVYGAGAYVAAGGNAQFRNVTIANNGGVGFGSAGTVTATNSILWGNIGYDATGTVALAWCDVGVKNSTVTTNNYCLSTDPLFVNMAASDYHEQSKGGSWHNGAWTKDAAMSPCIDAGDPADPRGALEPQPNSKNRINMGAYGGEAQASKSAPTGGTTIMFR